MNVQLNIHFLIVYGSHEIFTMVFAHEMSPKPLPAVYFRNKSCRIASESLKLISRQENVVTNNNSFISHSFWYPLSFITWQASKADYLLLNSCRWLPNRLKKKIIISTKSHLTTTNRLNDSLRLVLQLFLFDNNSFTCCCFLNFLSLHFLLNYWQNTCPWLI